VLRDMQYYVHSMAFRSTPVENELGDQRTHPNTITLPAEGTYTFPLITVGTG